ncbi:hypothetical protein [Enterococcus gallinarum]|uniref:hypothetical protein n=1 Tax=Enterococcus gallinarum TaxID=1353 RepID=UPI0024339C48|nr:hypothetical protein [Enterococcus gallinarum]
MTYSERFTYEMIESKFDTTSFDPTPYIESTLLDHSLREKLVKNVIDGKNHINYYFNSYLIIERASLLEPTLFYPYWEDFWQLHAHKNSYHRRIAHDLVSHLVACDVENKFSNIKDDYLGMIETEKISNLLIMLQNAIRVAQITPLEALPALFSKLENLPHLTDKQKQRISKLHREYETAS